MQENGSQHWYSYHEFYKVIIPSNRKLLQVIEYWAWQLIDGYKSRDPDITKFLNYYDFWLVPFHNPDGK